MSLSQNQRLAALGKTSRLRAEFRATRGQPVAQRLTAIGKKMRDILRIADLDSHQKEGALYSQIGLLAKSDLDETASWMASNIGDVVGKTSFDTRNMARLLRAMCNAAADQKRSGDQNPVFDLAKQMMELNARFANDFADELPKFPKGYEASMIDIVDTMIGLGDSSSQQFYRSQETRFAIARNTLSIDFGDVGHNFAVLEQLHSYRHPDQDTDTAARINGDVVHQIREVVMNEAALIDFPRTLTFAKDVMGLKDSEIVKLVNDTTTQKLGGHDLKRQDIIDAYDFLMSVLEDTDFEFPPDSVNEAFHGLSDHRDVLGKKRTRKLFGAILSVDAPHLSDEQNKMGMQMLSL